MEDAMDPSCTDMLAIRSNKDILRRSLAEDVFLHDCTSNNKIQMCKAKKLPRMGMSHRGAPYRENDRRNK